MHVAGLDGHSRGLTPWHVDHYQLGWKERNDVAEALPFGFNLAQAADVGRGEISGEEPIKTWRELATSAHFDYTTCECSSIWTENVFLSSFQK